MIGYKERKNFSLFLYLGFDIVSLAKFTECKCVSLTEYM